MVLDSSTMGSVQTYADKIGLVATLVVTQPFFHVTR